MFIGRPDFEAETPNTLATWYQELTHWKRPWCWEGLGAGGEGDNRGWDGWMASPTWWTWVRVNSGSWWWTGRPGLQWFMGSQRDGHRWMTELNVIVFLLIFCMDDLSIDKGLIKYKVPYNYFIVVNFLLHSCLLLLYIFKHSY